MERVDLENHSIEISNAGKILFPADGITKADLIEYYRRISGVMLPHLEGRPLTLHRFPDGLEGEAFFQKSVPGYFPAWVKRASVEKEDGVLTQVICEDTATLVYLANQACIALHTWLSRIDKPRSPDQLIFDLDPSDDDFSKVASAARDLKELLTELGLPTFVKTTGSRGLHVLTPLNRRQNFDSVRSFARQTAKLFVGRDPSERTVQQRKEKRAGKLFIDTGRNAYAQLAVAPYSVRALPGAPVATPLDWSELSGGSMDSQKYTIENIFRRLGNKDDPWGGMTETASSLAEPKRRLKALLSREQT